MKSDDVLLHCVDLCGSYQNPKRGKIIAVNNVSLQIHKNETVGLVGESGCGKSTLSRLLLRLQKADSGSVFFEQTDVLRASSTKLHKIRQYMQVVFQDPYSSLDPVMKIGLQIREGLDIYHKELSKEQRIMMVHEILQQVGLKESHYNRFPSSLSGGQLQRVAIAQALIMRPRFIICDEPVSALDVSVQAQILNLLKSLQESSEVAYLFISHNIRVVYYMADTIAVMYAGCILEFGNARAVAETPLHPYTRALHRSLILEGDTTSTLFIENGCSFAPRCPFKKAICLQQKPKLKSFGDNHYCACHFAGTI
ncbi:MAG: ABC transporter ATP-binding protein [Treponema sp.]|nr:ABC transporter ATP-binding protein [Treponema sp.]